MSGIARITKERMRQILEENWTPGHDDQHIHGEMALAAACYAAPIPIRAERVSLILCDCRSADCQHSFGFRERKSWQDPWPWDSAWDKRSKHDRIRQLEIAGALIAAEIDRLERQENI
jgi:hypothetical protein